ncbi:CehA/McbA family metallohydrolase [Candidatus Haliotispira prima]|uniref:CehA/McbA family metallohydrolase n=1 Tax=Candidatus Haliotispira prima TaxID=3034016 RepID=A0ABY8MHT0_9SPIO|nr:CehA/McbA family metallohydrolase [Candidatus Haliotispira prima]
MNQKQCLQFSREFPPGEGKSYSRVPFEVPPNTEYIVIRGRYKIEGGSGGTIDIGLADAEDRTRGWSGNLNRLQQIFLGEEQASLGYLAGPLQPGTWNILLGESRKHSCPIAVKLELELLPCKPRIVRGDVHGHSLYSDGAHSIETKLQMARENGLDFLGFTDHNSVAQNFCLPVNPDVLLLPSCEITTYNGHLNIFGYRERRIPNFMCRSSEDVRQVLTDLKDQAASGTNQGLWIQLNHPIRNNDVAGCQWNWDYDMPFDWIEVWNGSWNQNSIANVRKWQDFLEQGRFLPAVANSDFHCVEIKRQGYPCNNVWVAKKTEREILLALANGHNYVTAEPLPKRSFGAFCRLGGKTEEVLFGSTVRLAAGSTKVAGDLKEGEASEDFLVLELTVAKSYLAELEILLLRVWNEFGLCLELEPDPASFRACEESDSHDHKFCLELDAKGRPQNLPYPCFQRDFQGQQHGETGVRAARADQADFRAGNAARPFLRFELFELDSAGLCSTKESHAERHKEAHGESQEKALLLTNPIFLESVRPDVSVSGK